MLPQPLSDRRHLLRRRRRRGRPRQRAGGCALDAGPRARCCCGDDPAPPPPLPFRARGGGAAAVGPGGGPMRRWRAEPGPANTTRLFQSRSCGRSAGARPTRSPHPLRRRRRSRGCERPRPPRHGRAAARAGRGPPAPLLSAARAFRGPAAKPCARDCSARSSIAALRAGSVPRGERRRGRPRVLMPISVVHCCYVTV